MYKNVKLQTLSSLIRQLVLLCLFSSIAILVNAQRAKGNYNFLSFEQKPYYFGITLGVNNSTLNIFKSDKFTSNNNIRIVEDLRGPGFNLGIVSNLKVGKFFDFRFLPTLSFADKTISYTPTNNNLTPTSRNFNQTIVQLPFHIRYKSAPFNDLRLFIIGGFKYGFDVENDNDRRQADELVQIASTDFAAEFGVGVQFFFPYFIFSPEIKISHGLGNILIYDDSLIESSILEKVISRAFTLSFHFEG